MKRLLTLKPTSGRKLSNSSLTGNSSQQHQAQLSPKKFKTDVVNDYNENIAKLLDNRLLLMQLLHFECALLSVLPPMLLNTDNQDGLKHELGSNCSPLKLQDLMANYYLLMNKLCYGKFAFPCGCGFKK